MVIEEGNALLQEKLLTRAIQSTPGVCVGYPRIRNTRIPVWTLVSFRQQGADETELLRNSPSLTPLDLNAAWLYYEHHRKEIDTLITTHQADEGEHD